MEVINHCPLKKNCPVELLDVGFHGDLPSRYEPGLFLLFRISEGPRREDSFSEKRTGKESPAWRLRGNGPWACSPESPQGKRDPAWPGKAKAMQLPENRGSIMKSKLRHLGHPKLRVESSIGQGQTSVD